MRRSGAQTRELVLEVTHELFYCHGIRATGIDRIAASADVSPTTLYRLFASKEPTRGSGSWPCSTRSPSRSSRVSAGAARS